MKKKDCYAPALQGQNFIKLLLLMKLSIIIIFLSCFQSFAFNGTGQSRINLKLQNTSIEAVLKNIELQGHYSFVYKLETLPKDVKINVYAKNATLEYVMDRVLQNTTLSYKKIDKNLVVIVGKKELADVVIRPVTGTVTNEKGEPVDNVSIVVKGTNVGSITNTDGTFTINVPDDNTVLEFSSIGYETQTVNVSAGTTRIAVVLKAASSNNLEEVVVTALGISKEAKTLTYSLQKVDGSDLSTVKNTNPLNSLNGKVAGLQINRSSAGAGGSVRIVLRGDKSTRNSQPLFVIDGLPIINSVGGPDAGLYNGSPDVGDVLSTLNPDDIESINILKGASASALYGSIGGNGVILIQTKKGKAGVSKIDFSSSVTFDKVNVLPKLQYKYNQSSPFTATTPGSEDSWGAAGSTQPNNDYLSNFFKTGVTFINSIGLTTGNEKSNSYFSYSNTDNKGVLPNSGMKQHTLTFRQSNKFFNDRLIFDGTFMGSIQNSKNRLTPGIYYNPLTGLYLLPRGINIDDYKNFEFLSTARYINVQNWWNINYDKDQANGGGWGGQDYQQNPYWILNRNVPETRNQNVYSSVSLKYLLNDWLTLQTRGNINNRITKYERKAYASTQATLSRPNGTYSFGTDNTTDLYGDLILTGEKEIASNFKLGFTLGASTQYRKGRNMNFKGTPRDVANVFVLGALDKDNLEYAEGPDGITQKNVQSVFGSIDLNFKDKLFLNFSDRNDWSSTLAFGQGVNTTLKRSYGFNYFSTGASALLDKIFSLPAQVNVAKLRVSYAQVGNDLPDFIMYPLYTFASGNSTPPAYSISADPRLALRPELNKTLEIGANLALFNNRLSFDFTWYKSNVLHQTFNAVSLPGVNNNTATTFCTGNIQNKGVEISLSYKVVEHDNFKWNTAVNFTKNVNKIVQLFGEINSNDKSIYGLKGGGYSKLKQGGAYGDLYGRTIQYDAQGRMMVNATTHVPIMSGTDSLIGNPNPKFILGWNNTFDYKNLRIGFLIDGKFGGKVISITQGYLDQMGVSERTGAARDAGGVAITNAVDVNGQPWSGTIPADAYYKAISGKTPAVDQYSFDATAIRLRELSISYKLPISAKAIKDARIGVIGNNLFFFKRNAPFDPELVAGTFPGSLGVEAFGLPSYRSIGISLKCTF